MWKRDVKRRNTLKNFADAHGGGKNPAGLARGLRGGGPASAVSFISFAKSSFGSALIVTRLPFHFTISLP
jgi:hypothetical protein